MHQLLVKLQDFHENFEIFPRKSIFSPETQENFLGNSRTFSVNSRILPKLKPKISGNSNLRKNRKSAMLGNSKKATGVFYFTEKTVKSCRKNLSQIFKKIVKTTRTACKRELNWNISARQRTHKPIAITSVDHMTWRALLCFFAPCYQTLFLQKLFPVS